MVAPRDLPALRAERGPLTRIAEGPAGGGDPAVKVFG